MFVCLIVSGTAYSDYPGLSCTLCLCSSVYALLAMFAVMSVVVYRVKNVFEFLRYLQDFSSCSRVYIERCLEKFSYCFRGNAASSYLLMVSETSVSSILLEIFILRRIIMDRGSFFHFLKIAR